MYTCTHVHMYTVHCTVDTSWWPATLHIGHCGQYLFHRNPSTLISLADNQNRLPVQRWKLTSFWNIFKGVFSVWFPNRREDASGENWRREQWRSSPGVDGSRASAEERSSLVGCFFQDLIGMIANNQIMLRPVEGGDLEMMEQHYRQQNLWKWQQIIVEKLMIMTNRCWKQRWERQK